MNALLDTQGSFIIAGILLINLLGWNLTLSQALHGSVSSEVSCITANELTAILQDDFWKIGLGVSGQDAIVSLDSSQIVFLADLNNDGVTEQVQYSLSDTTAVPQTSNSHDRYLYRAINGSTHKAVALGVVSFRLAGYDAQGNSTLVSSEVRTLEFQLEIQPTDLLARGGAVSRFLRRERVSPFALQQQ